MNTSRRPALRSARALTAHRDVDLLVGLIACLVIMTGCEERQPTADSRAEPESTHKSTDTDPAAGRQAQTGSSAEQPEITYEKGDPPTEATVIARAGSVEVTFGEYQTFLKRTALFRRGNPPNAPAAHTGSSGSAGSGANDSGPSTDHLSKRHTASPRVQIQTARNLLRSNVVEHLARKHDISVTGAEVADFLKTSPKLNQFIEASSEDADTTDSELEVTELPAGNTLEDLKSIARERLRLKKLRETLLDQTNKQTLWRWYQHRHNRSSIMYVRQLNVADSKTIDQFVASHPEEIQTHYEDNSKTYRVPRLVEIRELIPSDEMAQRLGARALADRLQKAAHKLEEGTSPEKVAETLGLELKPSRKVGPREVSKAHDMSVGEADFRTEGAGAPHVWIVRGIQQSHPQKLDRSLRRQIASELLQQKGVVPSVERRLNQALELMRQVDSRSDGSLSKGARKQLTESLQQQGFDPKTTDLFTRDTQGYIPGIGIAQPVMTLAFELDGDRPVADSPVAARQHAYAVRLTDRQTPSRETFDSSLQDVRRAYTDAMRNRIVDAAVGDWYERHEPQLNLKPVRIVHGVLKNPKK